jgi:hypothetical protein
MFEAGWSAVMAVKRGCCDDAFKARRTHTPRTPKRNSLAGEKRLIESSVCRVRGGFRPLFRTGGHALINPPCGRTTRYFRRACIHEDHTARGYDEGSDGCDYCTCFELYILMLSYRLDLCSERVRHMAIYRVLEHALTLKCRLMRLKIRHCKRSRATSVSSISVVAQLEPTFRSCTR